MLFTIMKMFKAKKNSKKQGLAGAKAHDVLNSGDASEQTLHAQNRAKDKRNTRIVLWAIVSFTVGVILIGVISFFAALQRVETVNVPELRELHIVDAMIALQERGLVPQVQLRYHKDPALKDHILAQQPQSGTAVKIGKRITLFVSKGVVIDSVKNYIGRNINDVRTEIQSEFAIYEDSISIESVRSIFSDESAGIILSQNPPPQSEITGEINFSFVISKGKELRENIVGDYVGMNLFLALDSLALNEIPFQFEIVEDETIDDGTVLAQIPAPGSIYTPGLRVTLSVSSPNTQGNIFGLFQVEMPLFPAPLPVRLLALGEDGSEEVLFTMMHSGGALTIPYLLPQGSELRFFQADELILSKIITE